MKKFFLFFLTHLFVFHIQEIFSLEILPNPIPSCLGKQLSSQGICGTTACYDSRCQTCSQTSIVDCLVCNSPYQVARLSTGTGSCIKQCGHIQVSTDHYNRSSTYTFNGNDDVCLTATNTCTDPNCLSCLQDSPGLCLICNSTYFPLYNAQNQTSTCILCSNYMMNCTSCAWQSYCYQCVASSATFAGYLLAANAAGCQGCAKAFSRCGACDGQNTCTACSNGYFLLNNKCTSCLRNCKVCTNKQSCTTCNLGYYLANANTCSLCSSTFKNCLDCTDNTQCLKCQSSYFLQTPQQCTLCTNSALAIRCNGTNIIKCADNSTLVIGQNQCAPCSKTVNCEYCDGSSCLVCASGYLVAQNGTCVLDSSIPYCMKSDGKYCVQCVAGYYLLTNGTNVSCNICVNIGNCSVCDGIVCSSCLDNFYLQQPLTCSPCTNFSNCLKCDGKNCVHCNDGFFLYNDGGSVSCLSCSDPVTAIDKCVRCWNQNTCRKCDSGYLLDDNQKCQSIFQIPNCLSSDGITCTGCYAGYYLLKDKCYACSDSNCQICSYNPLTATSPCSQCRAGNYLSPQDFSCIQCSQNSRGSFCILCDYSLISSTSFYGFKCTRCQDGYGIILTQDNCTACTMTNCQICTYNPNSNTSMCNSCDSGYYQETTGVCTFCGDQYCTSCNKSQNSYICNQCVDSYFLDSYNICRSCQLASDGCSVCSLNTTTVKPVCLQCSSQNYNFNSSTNMCVPCSNLINNCSMCTLDTTNSLICFICNQNFYLQTPQNCTQCQSNLCLTCSGFDSGKSCSLCMKGYYVNSQSLCDVCTKAVPNCQFCNQLSPTANATCNTCLPGFYLNQNNSCAACGTNCQNCTNATYCNNCFDNYYAQINSTGSYCLSAQCPTPLSLADNTKNTCQLCSDLFFNCSECSSSANCTKCHDTYNTLMLPDFTSCAVCGDNLHVNVNNYCAYKPMVADPITRSRSSLTGKVEFQFNCTVPQTLTIYGVFFLNYDNYLDNITFDDVKGKFDNQYNINYSVSLLNRNLSDRYWTNYFAISTDNTGNTGFWLSEFMNADVNYRIYVWCYNNGSASQPLSIPSNNYTFDWIQEDNQGQTVKFGFKIESTLTTDQRSSLADILSNMLGLDQLNRNVIYNVIDDQQTARLRRILQQNYYEFFYIERDYTVIPFDNTNMDLLKQIQDPSFLNNINSKTNSLDFQIESFTYTLFNSSFQFVVPVFKSIDFSSILTINFTTAAMNLSIINTNANIYVGIIDDVTIDSIDWAWFVQQKANQNTSFAAGNFQKQYLKVNNIFQWKQTNLVIGKTYALYIGATNEDEFLSSLRTPILRAIFRPKNSGNR